MASKRHKPKHRQFCQALAELSEDRPRGRWASIDSVAARLGIDSEKAVQLASECERAGLVRHDLSQHSGQRGETDLPHSVILGEGGWLLLMRRGRGKVKGGRSG